MLKSILSLTLPLLILSASRPATAATDGQFCLSNHLGHVASAVVHNVSIGIKVFDSNRKPYIAAPGGGPLHMNWLDGDACYNAQKDSKLVIYTRNKKGNWYPLQEYQTEWLDGIDLQFHREGRWFGGQGFGINLSFQSNNPSPDPAKWMERTLNRRQDIRFSDMCLPGSHAAGTYAQNSESRRTSYRPEGSQRFYQKLRRSNLVFRGSVIKQLSNWTRTQEQNIAEQLDNGIRYLDLTLTLTSAPDSSELQFVSAYGLEGATLTEVLIQINSFLNTNPDEFVVLDIKLVQQLAKYYPMLFDAISAELPTERLLKSSLGLHFKPFDQLNGTARIMVVSPSNASEDQDWIWNRRQTLTRVNKEDDSQKTLNNSENLRASLTGHLGAAEIPGLTLVPLYLKPAIKDYSFNPLDINSLGDLNNTLRWPSGMARYTANALRSYGYPLNIVSQDFSDTASSYSVCMAEMERSPVRPNDLPATSETEKDTSDYDGQDQPVELDSKPEPADRSDQDQENDEGRTSSDDISPGNYSELQGDDAQQNEDPDEEDVAEQQGAENEEEKLAESE